MSNITIKVRVTDTEKKKIKSKNGEFELFAADLVDEHGGEIRAVAFGSNADAYSTNIFRNQTYIIFKAAIKISKDSIKKYSRIKHDCHLVLNQVMICINV